MVCKSHSRCTAFEYIYMLKVSGMPAIVAFYVAPIHSSTCGSVTESCHPGSGFSCMAVFTHV